jgi:hypothetical protein
VVGTPLGDPVLASTSPLPIDEAVSALTWQVPAGESGLVLRQVDLPEFTFGWYTGRLPLQAPGAAPDTAVARIKIFSPSGGDYFSQTIYARDLPADGQFRFSFKSPLYNGWGFPPTILVSATGQSELRLGMLSLEPDRQRSLGLAALWLIVLALAGAGLVAVARPLAVPSPITPVRTPTPFTALTNYQLPITLLLLLLALLYAFWPHARTLAAVSLPRSTGAVVKDPAAYGGRAMEASPQAGNDPGKLAASHPELYGPGHYRVSVSIARLTGELVPNSSESAVAVRVFASDAESLAQRWDIPAAHLPLDERYQPYGFEFFNPRQQALTFVVDYGGVAGVRVDQIVVERVR